MGKEIRKCMDGVILCNFPILPILKIAVTVLISKDGHLAESHRRQKSYNKNDKMH